MIFHLFLYFLGGKNGYWLVGPILRESPTLMIWDTKTFETHLRP
jgi:hypothetical protein